MSEPSRHTVETYYDSRIEEKLSDFVDALPRVEMAIRLIEQWAPQKPSRVLEIGCGVGATCWRMARAWPDAQVIGADISPDSINVARACFELPNLTYHVGLVNETNVKGPFDLIVMMDVYEHIPPSQRLQLHATLKNVLADDSRFILTSPTPAHQQRLRRSNPQALQPVDEDVGIVEINSLLADTATNLLYYREMGIWSYGDYFHLVVGRYNHFDKVAQPYRPCSFADWLRRTARAALGRTGQSSGRKHYLGTDAWRCESNPNEAVLQVAMAERRRIVRNASGRLRAIAKSLSTFVAS